MECTLQWVLLSILSKVHHKMVVNHLISGTYTVVDIKCQFPNKNSSITILPLWMKDPAKICTVDGNKQGKIYFTITYTLLLESMTKITFATFCSLK